MNSRPGRTSEKRLAGLNRFDTNPKSKADKISGCLRNKRCYRNLLGINFCVFSRCLTLYSATENLADRTPSAAKALEGTPLMAFRRKRS